MGRNDWREGLASLVLEKRMEARHLAIAADLEQGYFVDDIIRRRGYTWKTLTVSLSQMRTAGIPIPSLWYLKSLDPRRWGNDWHLSDLCKNRHTWNGTNLSLYRVLPSGGRACISCVTESVRKHVKKKRLIELRRFQ